MASAEEQTKTQLANIERATGATVEEWAGRVADAGVEQHGQIVAWLKTQGLTHGNANALAHAVRATRAGGPASSDALLDAQYAGGKAALRPVHDELVRIATTLGEDVEVVTQKTAVSLRRGKQFAMIEAPSSKRVRLGFNLRGVEAAGRVVAATGMCTHRVELTSVAEIDDEVVRWLADAYGAAGRK